MAERKLWGELFLDEDGEADFKFHIERGAGGFLPAKEALEKFIALLQERLNNAKQCPFYEDL